MNTGGITFNHSNANRIVAAGSIKRRQSEQLEFALIKRPEAKRKKLKHSFSGKFQNVLRSRLGKLSDLPKQFFCQIYDHTNRKLKSFSMDTWLKWLTGESRVHTENIERLRLMGNLVVDSVEDSKKVREQELRNLSSGSFSELRVAHVLDELKSLPKETQKTIFRGYEIVDYTVHAPNSREDHQKKDISLTLQNPKRATRSKVFSKITLPIQVKAGGVKKSVHQRHYHSGENIPIIKQVVNKGKDKLRLDVVSLIQKVTRFPQGYALAAI